MDTAKKLLEFHQGLNIAIASWALTIWGLMKANEKECYALGFALMDVQPGAKYIDFAVKVTMGESEEASC